MKVKLFFPPHFSFFQPYIALPSLAAFLRQHNFSVSIIDMNIASFHWFLRQEYLSGLLENLKGRKSKFEENVVLSDTDIDHYNAVVRAILAGDTAICQIEEALEFFRISETFCDLKEYVFFERVVQDCFRVIAAAYYPTYISLIDFEMQYSLQSSRQIFDAIDDRTQNPYIQFFEEYLPNKISKQVPGLVGISLTSASQVIPAFTLAKTLKAKKRNIQIVIGGVMANHLAEKVAVLPQLFTLFDYLIKGEGETPLFKLCQSLAGQLSLTSVPNLIYYAGGVIRENGNETLEDVGSLPTPDYSDLPLEQYLAPVPILSIEPARGCYWRKCTFCNQYNIHNNSFRKRSVGLVIADIAALKKKHRTACFNISNEGVPETHLRKMAEAIVEQGLQIQWYAGAQLKGLSRQTCRFLRQAGCRKLIFGLESGSQRVLDLMRKGTNLEKVPTIIQNCTDAGIDVHLYLMVGFPTETLKEIEATRDYVLSLLPFLRRDGFTFYISTFQAMIQAPILEQLGDMGYSIEPKGGAYDLEYVFDWAYHSNRNLGYSKEQLSEIAEQCANRIYSQLPSQTVPEEMTHYMCFVSQETQNIKYHKEKPTNIELNRDTLITKSEMISMQNVKFIGGSNRHDLKQGTIIYNLRTGKHFLLNCPAARLIDNMQQATRLSVLLEKGPFAKKDFELYTKRLIEEDIVSIKED